MRLLTNRFRTVLAVFALTLAIPVLTFGSSAGAFSISPPFIVSVTHGTPHSTTLYEDCTIYVTTYTPWTDHWSDGATTSGWSITITLNYIDTILCGGNPVM
jgi:hypothetical protein